MKKIILIALLTVIVFFNVSSILNYSVTYDEPYHYQYGQRVVTGNFSREHLAHANAEMPFSVLNVLPGVVYSKLRGKEITEEQGIKMGRYITVLFSLLLAAYIFLWVKRLYNLKAAYFSLFLYAFSPTVLGHSCLVTLDLYAACFMFIATYYLWNYFINKSTGNLIKSALFLGIAQLAKYSAILLFPIFLILALIWHKMPKAKMGRHQENSVKKMRLNVAKPILYIAIVLIVMNAGFLFKDSFVSLSELKAQSKSFKTISKYIGNIKLPLPFYYLQGIDKSKKDDAEGWGGKIYLHGKLSYGKGFKEYFLYAFLWKVPFATQLLFLFAVLLLFLRHKRFRLEDELFLIVPFLFVFIYFSFFFNSQIGIRYILPVFPFMFVFIGKLFYIEELYRKKIVKIIIAGLGMWLVISQLSYYPIYLAYFNESIGGRLNAYRFLADSNLDWGQSWGYVERYIRQKNGAAEYLGSAPSEKHLVILGANDLLGVTVDPKKYKWIREGYKPISHVGFSYLVFDLDKRKD